MNRQEYSFRLLNAGGTIESSCSADRQPKNGTKSTRERVSSGATLLRDAYPHDTQTTLNSLIARYERSGRAQNVSFRKLVPWIKVGERATHYLHPYPAKLLPQIAHFFLAANQLSRPGDFVLDPFGGSGTVALEAMLCGRIGLFADANPLARYIASVKTTAIKPKLLISALGRVKRSYKSLRGKLDKPTVINLHHWYEPNIINSLGRIKRAIDREPDSPARDFLLVTFSATCRKVSNADPRLSVPVKIRETYPSRILAKPWITFLKQFKANIGRMQELLNLAPTATRKIKPRYVGNDARQLHPPTTGLQSKKGFLSSESISLIITSPPYAGAQKYVRASSLNMGWLGMAAPADLKPLENMSIGREHFAVSDCAKCPTTGIDSADRLIKRVHASNSLRATIVATYLNEMREAMREMVRVLKPGGHLVLVIGNNEVCGLPFRSSVFLTEICEGLGLRAKLRLIDEIKSRGLMTKRNKTASVITREWVILFEKPKHSRSRISAAA